MERKSPLEEALQQLEQELKGEEARAAGELADGRTRILGTIRMELVRNRRVTLMLIKSRYGA